jgi:hypothetical protein
VIALIQVTIIADFTGEESWSMTFLLMKSNS